MEETNVGQGPGEGKSADKEQCRVYNFNDTMNTLSISGSNKLNVSMRMHGPDAQDILSIGSYVPVGVMNPATHIELQ